MKATTFFKTIVLSSIMALAVGCGKDNKSGNYNSFMDLYQEGNSDPNSRLALEQLSTWYNSNRESRSQYQDGLYKIEKVKFTQTSSTGGALPPGCKPEKVWIFEVIVCTGGSNPNEGTGGSVVSTKTIDVRSNDGVIINQKGNNELASVLNGSSGRMVSARSVGYGAYELVFITTDNSKVTSFIINTGVNSAFNPTSQTVRSIQSGLVEQIGTRVQLLQPYYNGVNNGAYPY